MGTITKTWKKKGFSWLTIISILIIAVMLIAGLFVLTGCGDNETATGGSSNQGGTSVESSNVGSSSESGTAQDLVSKYTKSEDSFVDDYDYAKEYMMPDDGVYTGHKSTNIAGQEYFSFSVYALTKTGLENYKNKLLNNGFEYKNNAYYNYSENIKITISNYVSTSNSITVYVYPNV